MSSYRLLNIIAIVALPASGSVIEVQFSNPDEFPNEARCVVEVFVGDDFCTSQQVGENEQWHATMLYSFDPAQKNGRATFRIIGAPDWAFPRPEKKFTVEAQVGLGILIPERREKVVANALKTSRGVTESSEKKSPARIEKAAESLKGAAAAVATNKDKAEVLVALNDLAELAKTRRTAAGTTTNTAKDFVVSELPKIDWQNLNRATTKSVFMAASGVAEKFTQREGGKKNALGLYGQSADANPEAAKVWDTVTAEYAKVNPQYAREIANPRPEAVAMYGSTRAFKEQTFRQSLYESKN